MTHTVNYMRVKLFSSSILEEMNDEYPSFDLKSSVTQYFDTATFDGRQNSYRSSTRVACDPRLEDAAIDCLTVSPEIHGQPRPIL